MTTRIACLMICTLFFANSPAHGPSRQKVTKAVTINAPAAQVGGNGDIPRGEWGHP